MRFSVRIEKSVNTEISVVLFFLMIPSVCVLEFVLILEMVYGMIRELPYTTANEIVVFVYYLPVIFKRARAESHSVSVLA